MADSNNNSSQQQQEETSTISYLPILFANGYPTSLDKMSVEQLELFIPFLVKCSLNLKVDDLPKEAPVWWPETQIEYDIPFEKPKTFKGNWKDAMKVIVQQCYDHHKQPFLLKYSNDLSLHDTANLRYVRDSISTTALWSRNPKKLLLTFRNELMLYDKKKRRQLWKKDESQQESTDESENFFLTFCDNCDATFISEEAYTEHEKKCNSAPENDEQEIENIVISDDEVEEEYPDVEAKNQTDFMAYFFLASSTATELPRRSYSHIERSLSPKKKKKQTRTRNVITQKDREKEFSIPFSSPAGMVLTKKSTDESYNLMKVGDIESYCTAKPTTKIQTRTKMRFQQSNTETYLMKAMRKTRPYCWPKRRLHSGTREANFELLNRWLIEDCRPLSVVMRKLTTEDIVTYREKLSRLKLERERATCVDLISDSDSDEDAPIVGMEEGEVTEAMTKLDGHLMSFPLIASTSISRALPKYSDIPRVPLSTTASIFVTDDLRKNQRTIVKKQNESGRITQQTTTTTSEFQNGFFKRPSDGELNHDSKRSKTIHEWLNNVNGESFNQISHLVNS